ncbi:MAG: hypothetical protein ABW277_03180 [Longimicrobiaceae bacterium]
MTDESAAGLLKQIREAEGRQPTLPWVLGGTAVALLLTLMAGAPGWLTFAGVALGAGATAWAHLRDVAVRAVVLFYDLEPDARAAYEELHVAFVRLAGAKGAWNVEARAETNDQKRNAGATRLVQRQRVRLAMGVPGVIRTNIDVPAIPCGQETLHFFPDRLLVSSPRGIGAVPYDQLEITVESGPFVESDPVPADASEIGTTWQYVNRDGGPDRRFSDNRQLPILLYEQVTFTSPTGLHEVLQLSRTGGGLSFRSTVETLGRLAGARGEGSYPRGGGGGSEPIAAREGPAGGVDLLASAGVFQGEVSGDVDCRLGGRAVFGSRPNDRGETIFYIVLRHAGREGEGEHAITLSNALDGLPAPGRYSFGDMGPRTFIGIYTHETEGGSSGTYLPSEGGVVEIESATERAIRGRLEFRAEGSNTYNLWAVQGHVRLSATFTADPTEGDPYELARLPGELRALAEADGEETLLDGSDADVPTSLDAFAAGIVEHLVVGLSLPLVFEVFADYGVEETQVRRVEALLFAALPFDALLKVGHFGERSGEVQTAFRRAVAVWAAATAGVSGDTMAKLVEGRLDEYAGILFNEGELAVREDGMLDLAVRAYCHIVGGESDDYGLLTALFTQFGSVSKSLDYGQRLAELHDLYLIHGDEIWEGDEAA